MHPREFGKYRIVKLLPLGGMGRVYLALDSDTNRRRQEAAYLNMGMTIITGAEDSFTATREGFWSQRFTEEKMRRYCAFAPPEQISFTPLDTYQFAMQVRIQK